MGIGPNLSWKGTSNSNLRTNLLYPSIIATIAFNFYFSSDKPFMSSLAISSIVWFYQQLFMNGLEDQEV